jgi:hypothetical protein
MNWGEVELEPEEDDWSDTLDQGDKETAAFYVDLLAERGVLLGEPYTRQLRRIRRVRSEDSWASGVRGPKSGPRS